MCNIAGYNGTRRAAPILLEMIRAQEGLDGGFYTGIATFHEGKIYCAKAVGCVENLIKTTNALDLPGTMGIVHSRTPGKKLPANGGPDCWAHPFTCEKDGRVEAALVMNGAGGIFKGTFSVAAIAEQLLAEGFEFKTRLPDAGNTVLSDGSHVHSTDVRCQLAAKHLRAGLDGADAMEAVYTQMPCEAVSLLLSLNEPAAISYARLNFPMHVAFADHGAYMATAPIAIPEDAPEYTLLPTMSCGKVYRSGFTARKFQEPPAAVAPITDRVRRIAYDRIEQLLRTPMLFADMGTTEYLKPFYPAADCTQRATVAYQIISDFHRRGRLDIETRYIPGDREGLTAPKFYLSLKD